MPNSREILLKVISETRTDRLDKLSPFQLTCLDKIKDMIQLIPVDEKTETDLRTCGFLLDQCLCDLDMRKGSEHSILSLMNKDYITNDDFCEKVYKLLDDEIQNSNKNTSDGFYDQSFRTIRSFLINMKTEIGRLKTELDQRAINTSIISYSEYQTKFG